MNPRIYHLFAVNEKRGWRVCLTSQPLPHHQACVLKSKFTPHPARRLMLVEA